MVSPGVTTRKPRVNRRLPGCRTELIVCQAMSIAMTVVFPAPVASLRASRCNSGLDCSFADRRWSRKRRPVADWGATSVSQIAVSAASTWQKKGRMPAVAWWRQWCSRRAVSGVTFHWLAGNSRQSSTIRRRSLMIGVGSYCWPSVSSFSAALSKTSCR